jgi:glycosyltransferase involved in cell wall biosynthesis
VTNLSLRILFVVNHAGFFLSHRLPLAVAAVAAGYEVHVATPASKHVAEIREAGLQWHEIRLVRSRLNPVGELRTFWSLLRLYKSIRPDIIHHVTSKPVLYGTIAARLGKVAAVVNAVSGMGHVFVTSERRASLIRAVIMAGYRLALRHPRMLVIFQNESDRASFMENGLLSEQTVLIPGSGVDVSVFDIVDRSERSLPMIVFPGRMLTTKGLAEFVEAARILQKDGVRARFVLAGEPDPENLASVPEEIIRRWVSEGLVEYRGRCHDMPRIFREADVACLPSYREGLPKALIEAAASGLPVVTTDVPGCRDVVQHGRNGFLVPARDPVALAEALRLLIEDPLLRKTMGLLGRERAVREFALDNVVAATLDVYRVSGAGGRIPQG